MTAEVIEAAVRPFTRRDCSATRLLPVVAEASSEGAARAYTSIPAWACPGSPYRVACSMCASVSSNRVNRRSAFSGVNLSTGSSAGLVCTGGSGHGPSGTDHRVAGSSSCFVVTLPFCRSEPTACRRTASMTQAADWLAGTRAPPLAPPGASAPRVGVSRPARWSTILVHRLVSWLARRCTGVLAQCRAVVASGSRQSAASTDEPSPERKWSAGLHSLRARAASRNMALASLNAVRLTAPQRERKVPHLPVGDGQGASV